MDKMWEVNCETFKSRRYYIKAATRQEAKAAVEEKFRDDYGFLEQQINITAQRSYVGMDHAEND